MHVVFPRGRARGQLLTTAVRLAWLAVPTLAVLRRSRPSHYSETNGRRKVWDTSDTCDTWDNRPEAVIQSLRPLGDSLMCRICPMCPILFASHWSHYNDLGGCALHCQEDFPLTTLGARPHLGAMAFGPEDAYPCF